MEVHVVSKLDIKQHATFSLSAATLPALAASSVRVKTQLISLTSNNLTYAKMGNLLRWWDTYPVSQSYPAPYNDPTKWGIVPAWGYASIQDSNIPELKPGTLIYGYWPTSAALTDLKLEATAPSGHWIETSEHRQGLMGLYNQYTVQSTPSSVVSAISDPALASPSDQDELDKLGWSAVFATWHAGHHLSEYVFSPRLNFPPIHPLGNLPGLSWTEDDADISKAVVVSLAASGKTGRMFAYFFERKAKKLAPLGFLQVTSAVEGVSKATELAEPSFPSEAIGYNEISEPSSMEWIKELSPSKIIILDFGARDGALQNLLDSIKGEASLQASKTVIVQIGGPQKIISEEQILAARQEGQGLGKVQYNTFGVGNTAVAIQGAEAFHEELAVEWEKLINHRHLIAPDLEIFWKDGVNGVNGIEGAWDMLCNEQVGANEAFVYRVQRLT